LHFRFLLFQEPNSSDRQSLLIIHIRHECRTKGPPRLKSTPAADILYLRDRSFMDIFFDQKKKVAFVLTVNEEII
jgi:hypothetical protein